MLPSNNPGSLTYTNPHESTLQLFTYGTFSPTTPPHFTVQAQWFSNFSQSATAIDPSTLSPGQFHHFSQSGSQHTSSYGQSHTGVQGGMFSFFCCTGVSHNSCSSAHTTQYRIQFVCGNRHFVWILWSLGFLFLRGPGSSGFRTQFRG